MSTITIPATNGLGAALGSLLGKLPRWLLPALALLTIGAILASVVTRSHASEQLTTQPVLQQTLVQSVTASGTVNPQNLISVGTQVSGTIASIYVDYNSRVKRGQVLARLDPSTFQAQLDQARASLAQAEAQASQASASASGAASGVSVASAESTAETAAVAAAKANVTKAQAALTLAQKTEQRDAALLGQGYVAQSLVDTDRSNLAQNESAVAAAQAAVAQAQAQALASNATVSQTASTAQSQAASTQAALANISAAQAVVRQDELNLQHGVITSPVDGTVVARDVSVGQTVAASLQTPTLFSIAQNLAKMEVDINVGEPDIGNVKTGETVGFSVLAYPNETFHGTVSQVRINPQTLNNVVTYDVVVLVDNTAGKLLPGMTANATIDVAHADNALVVPDAALQWKPSTGAKAGTASATATTPWGTVNGPSASVAVTAGSNGTIYVNRDGQPAPIAVRVLLTNGTQAAVAPVQTDALAAGDRVVIASNGANRARSAAGSTRSPMNASPVRGGMRGIH